VRLDLQEFDAFSDAELQALAAQGTETHSLDRSYVLHSTLGYGVCDGFGVGVDLPFVFHRGLHEGVDMSGTPEVEDNGNQTGLGDVTLFAQWRAYSDLEAQTNASLYAGLEFPTGETDEKSPDGERLEPDHQPGSGSLDSFLGVALSHNIETKQIAASAMYTLAGDGSQDSNLGDVLRVNLAIGWLPERANESDAQFHWMLELNGQWHERMTMGGVTDADSGGVQVFASPGVRVTWPNHTTWIASLGIPLAQNLYGEQSETDFRLSTGVGFTF
jgi:hypothetical protein